VPARDRYAGLGAGGRAALQDPCDHLGIDLAHRHAQDRQSQDGTAAHGVDIRDRVRGGDPAEIDGIVDHWGEEVGGGDDAGAVVQLPDRRIVGGLVADEKAFEWAGGGLLGEEFAQDGGIELAAAAATMRQTGQTGCVGHR
jgi:hypothetical protein